MTLRVVVTDSDLGDDDVEAQTLGPDAEVVYANARSSAEVIQAAKDADGILVQWAPIDATIIQALPKLRAIVRFGVGLDNIDVQAAEAAGIAVSNVPDYCIDEVASHATSMIIASARRLGDYHAAVHRQEWLTRPVAPPRPQSEDPVGIAGFGRIGQAAAARLLALGHPVHVYDPLLSGTDLPVTVEDDLIALAARVNHLSLHMPLTDGTTGVCDAAVIDALGPEGHLVNTSRGPLVDEPALLSALNEGRLRWASLDVFTVEPPTSGSSLALAAHPHVTSTPHVAYLSTASQTRLRQHAAARLRDLLQQPTRRS